jgi:hypothetical protein
MVACHADRTGLASEKREPAISIRLRPLAWASPRGRSGCGPKFFPDRPAVTASPCARPNRIGRVDGCLVRKPAKHLVSPTSGIFPHPGDPHAQVPSWGVGA